MTDDVIRECHFETAADLWMHLMDPASYQARERWVFRGHGDSRWSLVPKAHRRDQLEAFLGGEDLLREKERHEQYLFRKFVLAADDAGLHVGPAAFSWAEKRDGLRGNWPPVELDGALALAQHYGLPTRLLDWSRSAATAAYFAATQAMAPAEGSTGGEAPAEGSTAGETACVWALQIEHAQNAGPRGCNPLRIVMPARAANPNLNAQGGMFSLIADAGEKPFALDQFVNVMEKHDVLEKLTFPISEAPRLAQIVADVAHITGRSAFPGYAGVVKSVEEELLRSRLLSKSE